MGPYASAGTGSCASHAHRAPSSDNFRSLDCGGSARNRSRRRRGQGDLEGHAPPRPLPCRLLCRGLSRPGQHRLCRADDEPGSRVFARSLRLGGRELLHRLRPVRGTEQLHPGPRRSAALDRQDHGELGHRFRPDGDHLERDELYYPSIPSGFCRSRIFSRHPPLLDLLVSRPASRADPCRFLDCESTLDHHRRAHLGPGARYDGGCRRPRGLAMALHPRGISCRDPRRSRLLLLDRQAERRRLAHAVGEDLLAGANSITSTRYTNRRIIRISGGLCATHT